MLRPRPLNLGQDFQRSASGLLVPPERATRRSRPVGVDLFSGAGGFSLGFHQAGFHVAAAADGWADAAWAYLVNLGGPNTQVHLLGDELPDGNARDRAFHAKHRGGTVTAEEFIANCTGKGGAVTGAAGTGWISGQPDEPACEHFYLGDVRALTGARICEDLGLEPGELDAIFGGPPCQGFSRAGKQDVMDPRNSLVFDFMRIVCEANPKAFVLENVPGIVKMLTPEGVPVIDALARIAEDGGFGSYDAIRRSLLSHPDARAATRTTPVAKHGQDDEIQTRRDALEEAPTLFG